MSKVTFALFGASLALVGLLFAGLVSADPLLDPEKNTVRADRVEKTAADVAATAYIDHVVKPGRAAVGNWLDVLVKCRKRGLQ